MVKTHDHKLECYMLNTGGCGELVEHGLDGARKVKRKVTRVSIPEMASVIRGIARGTIRWSEDANWMVETPKAVDGVDMAKFELGRHYSQDKIDSLIAAIRHERAEYASQFGNLDPAISPPSNFSRRWGGRRPFRPPRDRRPSTNNRRANVYSDVYWV